MNGPRKDVVNAQAEQAARDSLGAGAIYYEITAVCRSVSYTTHTVVATTETEARRKFHKQCREGDVEWRDPLIGRPRVKQVRVGRPLASP